MVKCFVFYDIEESFNIIKWRGREKVLYLGIFVCYIEVWL